MIDGIWTSTQCDYLSQIHFTTTTVCRHDNHRQLRYLVQVVIYTWSSSHEPIHERETRENGVLHYHRECVMRKRAKRIQNRVINMIGLSLV
jgi:hypothetical protein